MTRRWREHLNHDGSLAWVECAGGLPEGGLGRCFCGAPVESTGGKCARHAAATFLIIPEVYWCLRCPVGKEVRP